MTVHRRKKPVTQSKSTKDSPSISSSKTRQLIRRYHVLLKEHALLSKQPSSSKSTALREIEEEIEGLGGLEAYQKMSVIGQSTARGGGSERVLVEWLRELGYADMKDEVGGRVPLELLEVGALHADNYQHCASWIRCIPIDLHSRDPRIQEQDFLLMNPSVNQGKWDVISLSLVVNFVGDPYDRGRMLSLAHSFLTQSRPSYLYLVLPLPCVLNSRFLTPEHLFALMAAIGFDLVRDRWKPNGKVRYWLWRRVERPGKGETGGEGKWSRKRDVRPGPRRNNFAILWDGL